LIHFFFFLFFLFLAVFEHSIPGLEEPINVVLSRPPLPPLHIHLPVIRRLLRFARKRDVDVARAAKQPDGQITKILSSPSAKNISLNIPGKSPF
jgi:hypothetical protein